MMTGSVLTLQLAQVLGLYLILIGLAGLSAPQRWRALLDDFDRAPGLVLLAGAVTFAIGAALVLAHSSLTDPLATLVTLFGWGALIKGALLIAVPGPVLRIGRAVSSATATRIWAIAAIVLGLLLGVAGLTGRAGFL
ncbi:MULTISPECIES: DUF2065 domain-containing protein [unclassified Sphingobium]|uniref:DUF2065 domain-containing protein n=1 Tax=unclassified Sphingobium TaxID=2611147 RepID=UPI002224455C|nr:MULTISPECIES: DUF2065 domain-containing protein [unclassified Sphingobium]MCW2395609.1 uncharacterized protein YjeT (DUF2065 family) [Sphingobium sp. B8D3B]MCW2419124.1 uncharacterized protein YjeT (DUF2065 family) [Sphingobium sp. B8D3C]